MHVCVNLYIYMVPSPPSKSPRCIHKIYGDNRCRFINLNNNGGVYDGAYISHNAI